MGILRRLRGGDSTKTAEADPSPNPPLTPTALRGGSHDIEVVGESHYQDALWHAVGGRTSEYLRTATEAVLVPETDNPHDRNAISVWIGAMKVGYFSREDAAECRAGLLALQAQTKCWIALPAIIAGGGMRANGPGLLGVWLAHDPSDFGLVAAAPPTPSAVLEDLRTGLSRAIATDVEDDSYDLSWLHTLPSDHVAAIKRLRNLLRTDPGSSHLAGPCIRSCT